jgi:hypothetical protein
MPGVSRIASSFCAFVIIEVPPNLERSFMGGQIALARISFRSARFFSGENFLCPPWEGQHKAVTQR